MRHTYARLPVSSSTFREVTRRLKEAKYNYAFVNGVIDMHGLALEEEPKTEKKPCETCGGLGFGVAAVPSVLFPGMNDERRFHCPSCWGHGIERRK